MKQRLDKEGGSGEQWRSWRSLRNKLNKELKNAKRNYLKRRVEHKMENSKSLWME